MRHLLHYIKSLFNPKKVDMRLYDLPNRQYACTAILPDMERLNKEFDRK